MPTDRAIYRHLKILMEFHLKPANQIYKYPPPAHWPHDLQEIDITKNSDLFARYRFAIPVVKIGEQTLKAPITGIQLQTALQIASTQ